ncbi:MAG: MBL fold metallo-hydrolase, partial [Thermoplasmatales archaeon]|nr:MBL fold metallo-hydrolase [Thermoplasmatales archaeon]
MKDINVINISSTNFYLLKCKEGYLLIDAGWVGKYNSFKKALRRLNISIDSIKFILITHHHHDHTALVQDIRKETKCKIIIHKYETDYIKKGITYINETKQFNIYLRLLDRVLSPFIKY